MTKLKDISLVQVGDTICLKSGDKTDLLGKYAKVNYIYPNQELLAEFSVDNHSVITVVDGHDCELVTEVQYAG